MYRYLVTPSLDHENSGPGLACRNITLFPPQYVKGI